MRMRQRPTKHVHKIGDEVIIVEPAVFLRVGYPLSLQTARETIEPLIGKDLAAVFSKAGAPVAGSLSGLPVTIFINDRDYDRALSAVAHAVLRVKNYGGSTRSIHTVLREDLRGKRARVAGKRVVKTGTYHRGYCGSSMDGWGESEPPYLDKVKTHVLLDLDLSDRMLFEPELEIEECHVQPYLSQEPGGVTLLHV